MQYTNQTMNVFKDLKQVQDTKDSFVVAIGNFDGVHRGHVTLLNAAKKIADDKGLPLAVLTFEPHPLRLFRPDDPPNRITPPIVKQWRLSEFGADTVFSIPFDWDFASQSADDFIQNTLKDGVNAAHVVIGKDFRFGQLRKGGPQDIKATGIDVTAIDKVDCDGGQVLSSSRIRTALRAGDINTANDILGWSWEVRGEIIKGDQRGRELGYPTANVKLAETVHPAYGVYATRVQIEGEDQWRNAATNIGIRPMFEIPVAQIESFIFDFDADIYGKILRIQPVKRLRGEAKFNSLDDLIAQMGKDCDQAKEILK